MLILFIRGAKAQKHKKKPKHNPNSDYEKEKKNSFINARVNAYAQTKKKTKYTGSQLFSLT